MFGYITIRRGERVALWDQRGEVRLLSGPGRTFLWRQTVQPLPHLIARPDEYLVVHHLNGRAEHIAGPAELWLDPAQHESLRVEKAIELGPDEAVMITAQRPVGEEELGPDQSAAAARRIITGPAQIVPAPDEAVERLQHFIAQPGQYLAVTHRDGHREHVAGPAALWQDPAVHESITVEEVMDVDANHALVVYRQEGAQVTRRVVRGPSRFAPEANEWLHEFRWHGADPRNPMRKIPRALVFQRLRTIPDQMYLDAEGVRTSDDALLTIRLMIFFELVNIERMLDQTHDPIADFINAVTADVIDFVAALSFHQFKDQTERLNELETYETLVPRAERIGYRIGRVVYRGYHASDKLQAMQDAAIEARTQLCLEAETERQAQDLADMKVERERERALRQQKLEQEAAEHQGRLARLGHDETLRQRQAEQQQALEARRQEGELELSQRRAGYQEKLGFLRGVRELDVNLTQYLVAQFRSPDRLIHIEGEGRHPQLHLHEQ